MYCFSGVDVFGIVFVKLLHLGHFLKNYKARAMKLRSCIHVEE